MSGWRGLPVVLRFATLAVAAVIVVAVVVAIGSFVTASPGIAPTSPGSPAAICEAFADGGPVEAVGAAFMAARGGEDWTGPARDGITGLSALAERVSGDEREDLLVFARDVEAGSRGVVVYLPSGAVDPAHGPAFEMYLAWNTFIHKYGPGCGLDLGL